MKSFHCSNSGKIWGTVNGKMILLVDAASVRHMVFCLSRAPLQTIEKISEKLPKMIILRKNEKDH